MLMLENCGLVIQQEDEQGAFGHDSAVSLESKSEPSFLLENIGIIEYTETCLLVISKFNVFNVQEDARAAVKLMLWKLEQAQRAGNL